MCIRKEKEVVCPGGEGYPDVYAETIIAYSSLSGKELDEDDVYEYEGELYSFRELFDLEFEEYKPKPNEKIICSCCGKVCDPERTEIYVDVMDGKIYDEECAWEWVYKYKIDIGSLN